LQPDSIIPDPSNPQSWNRFSYVINNPINRIDPSGHDDWACETASCSYNYYHHNNYSAAGELDYIKKDRLPKDYGVTLADGGAGDDWQIKAFGKKTNSRNWDLAYARQADLALSNLNKALEGKLHSIIGSATFTLNEHPDGEHYYGFTHGSTIDFYVTNHLSLINIYHEFGHVLNNLPGKDDAFSSYPGINNSEFLNNDGFLDTQALINPNKNIYYQHPMPVFGDVNKVSANREHWGDMFANYVALNIDLGSTAGSAMNGFVEGALCANVGVQCSP
jgi:hypothetical protein